MMSVKPKKRGWKKNPETSVEKKDKPKSFLVYTDGSFRPPHFGAWSYAIMTRDRQPLDTNSSLVLHATINQMELVAIHEALKVIPQGSIVNVWSDSQYAIKSLMAWGPVWRKNNWVTAAGAPVKNKELIDTILTQTEGFDKVWYHHVKGHAGHFHNELVDFLAQAQTRKAAMEFFETKKSQPMLLAP